MPIPLLDEHGLLPPGIHECSLAEIEERFAGFQGSDRRIRLFEKLRSYVAEVRFADLARALIIDGSFVTAKPDPGDIDLILVLKPDHVLMAELRPFEYNVVSKRRVRQNYRFDLFVVAPDSMLYLQRIDFFYQVRDQPTLRKGLLRVPIE